jgi:RNA recognition motif-containing protein
MQREFLSHLNCCRLIARHEEIAMAIGTRLYVGNLSYNTNESSLREVFEQEGRKVAEVKLVTDRDTGQPRGFAFVEMASPADAEAAIAALNGRELDGRTLKVNEAQERSRGGGRDGGRGGYGRGRG